MPRAAPTHASHTRKADDRTEVETSTRENGSAGPARRPDVLSLQRTVGNEKVGQLMLTMARLSKAHFGNGDRHPQISESGDEREQEARRASEGAANAPQINAGANAGLETPQTHDDAEAHQMADALGANAFAVRDHIYFGKGKYQPETSGGRRLLAHELAHVGQSTQSSTPIIQRDEKPGPTTEDPRETAKKMSPKDFIKLGLEFWQLQTKIYTSVKSVPANDADLVKRLKHWKDTITVELEVIDGSLAGDASLRSSIEKGYTDTIRAVAVKYAAALKQTQRQFYETHRDDIHEVAWPRGAAEASANVLSDAIALEDRQKIQVISTTAVPADKIDIEDLFSTKGGKTTLPLPDGVAEAQLASGITGDDIKHGLRNVAGSLTTQMSPPPLKLNSTINLALDLQSVGGDYALYRFTYYEHVEGKGKKATSSKRILIERLGSLGVEGVPPSVEDASNKRLKQFGFKFEGTWDASEKQKVLAAIALIPDSLLSLVKGVAFARDTADPGDPDAGGNYDIATHKITLFDPAFAKSSVRFGEPGKAVSDAAVFDVVHEIGHAIDTRRIQPLLASEHQAQEAVRTRFAEFETSPGKFENVPPEQTPEFNKMIEEVRKAGKAVDAAKSESGHVSRPGPSGKEIVEDPKAKTDFREAARKDGGVRISPYAEKSWEEFFAESFAVYITEPATLQRLRPNIYAFFKKSF